MRRIVRRLVLTLIVFGAVGFAVMNPGMVKAFYEGIYPSDPAKRQALELCFTQDHKFNRLESGEREACYQRMLQPGDVASTGRPAESSVNLVDLQHAAGAGNMPRNDIRRLEQNQNAAATHWQH